MKSTEGKIGRVFVLRLDDGDAIPICIEQFAIEKGITHAQVIMIGGIGKGQVVSGPRYSDVMPPEAMLIPVDGAHDVIGVGIIAPGDDGKPGLHMHAALGRSGQTLTGCLQAGVETWLIGEAILYEIIGARASRLYDPSSKFSLLEVGR